MSLHKVRRSRTFLALLAVALFAPTLHGQDRVDIFTGYSWIHPGYDTLVPNAQENVAKGFTLSGTYFFNRNFGLTLDSGNHFGCCCPQIFTLQAGPTFRLPSDHATPFVHVLAGLHRMDLLAPFGDENRFGLIVGGGLDVPLIHHLSIRLVQVDYEFARHSYSSGLLQPELNGIRLSTGLLWQFGSVAPPLVASAACSAQPSEVFAGEPVTATANGSNFNHKRTIVYNWSGDGTKASGKEASAQVDTTGLAPGSYHVQANLNDGSKRGTASCIAAYAVKQSSPPTISCSPNPGTVLPGGSSTISSNASSPDNRRLVYSYSATSGAISGSDSSATLSAANAPGQITITCNVADDRNPALTAFATTTVAVEAPPPPPPPPAEASMLNRIDFKRNSPRVDNTAKAILDDVALRLQRDPDAKAVLVGEAESSERDTTGLAAQRALNTKTYLVTEKGVDASRLETRGGSAAVQQAQIWLVPPSATFNPQGTQIADESTTRFRNRK